MAGSSKRAGDNIGTTVGLGNRYITFQVQGPFAGGHWNDAWLTFDEFSDTQYTWPTAGITVTDVMESTTNTASGATVHSIIWQIGPESFVLWEWEITS